MEVYYLSDGETSARMDLDLVFSNLRQSYDPEWGEVKRTGYMTTEALLTDIREAVDKQGFWHGAIDCYNVAIVGVHLIEHLNTGDHSDPITPAAKCDPNCDDLNCPYTHS